MPEVVNAKTGAVYFVDDYGNKTTLGTTAGFQKLAASTEQAAKNVKTLGELFMDDATKSSSTSKTAFKKISWKDIAAPIPKPKWSADSCIAPGTGGVDYVVQTSGHDVFNWKCVNCGFSVSKWLETEAS